MKTIAATDLGNQARENAYSRGKIVGRAIVEEYINVLEASHKEMIWPEGWHGLGGDNLHQFIDVIVDKVLAETYLADD